MSFSFLSRAGRHTLPALCAGVVLCVAATNAWAADPQSSQVASPTMSNWKWLERLLSGQADKTDKKDSKSAQPASTGKDPTAMSAELRKLLELEQEAKAAPAQAQAAPAAPIYNVPRIGLKALVIGRDANPSAVLAIGDKGTMIVRAGLEYPLSDGSSKVTMYVHKIDVDHVDLEIKPAGTKLVLH